VSVFAAGAALADDMTPKQKSTAIGATTGAVAGAVVGGPVGAVVGAGVGAYVGHEGAKDSGTGTARRTSSSAYGEADVRAAQQLLNDKGYAAGSVDGRWGPTTEAALKKFQKDSGIPESGTLDAQTTAALGMPQPSAASYTRPAT
jgi:phage tail tape-measure protein